MGAESHADARMRQLSVEAAEDGWRIAPHLWAGITTVRHGAGVMIVGDPDQVASTIQDYVELGCTSFCLRAIPTTRKPTGSCATKFARRRRP